MTRTVTPAARKQRQLAAVKHGVYATQSASQRRTRRLRGKVARLRRAFPHLRDKPSELLFDYCEAHTLRSMAAVELFDNGILNAEGDSRRLFADYRLLLERCHDLARTLGLLDAPRDQEADPLAALLAGGGR